MVLFGFRSCVPRGEALCRLKRLDDGRDSVSVKDAGWYVFSDNGTRRDDTACSDPDAAEDGDAKADPDIVFNDDRRRVHPGKVIGVYRMPLLDDSAKVLVPFGWVSRVRGAVVNVDIVRNQDPIADRDRCH